MTYARYDLPRAPDTVPLLPSWVTSERADSPDQSRFMAGAALAHLHCVLHASEFPKALLRARLALSAAEVCVAWTGRPERRAELRDALGFLQPGDALGPAGEIYAVWIKFASGPAKLKTVITALPKWVPEQISNILDAGQGGPVERAACVFEAALAVNPRDVAAAAALADMALAHALGWGHVAPLMANGLRRDDLRLEGRALSDACHLAVLKAAKQACVDAAGLTRRATRLRAVAPKLRANGSDAAVELFLTRDAVAPAHLTMLRSPRAARRFCDRLVELGAAGELTGRETFRLYGV